MDRIADNLRRMFSYVPSNYFGSSNSLTNSMFSHYVDVDLSTPVFELPLFCLKYFCKNLQRITENIQGLHLAVPLRYYGKQSSYKSMPTILSKEVLFSEISKLGLYKIPVSSDSYYYGTQGAVFDKDMKALCIASWRMLLTTDETSEGTPVNTLTLSRPILRISPHVYLDKADPVQSFIANKLLKTFLEHPVTAISYYTMPYLTKDYGNYTVQVIFEESPFPITSVPTPSISTSQQSLINTVIDNISDLQSFLPNS